MKPAPYIKPFTCSVVPFTYDPSMSVYEILCKVMESLQSVLNTMSYLDIDELNDDIQKLQDLLDAIGSTDYAETISNIMSDINKRIKGEVFIAPLTEQNGTTCYLGASMDGLSFTPFYDMSQIIEYKNDIKMIKYKDVYIMVSGVESNISKDCYIGVSSDLTNWDCRTYSFGIFAYRNSIYNEPTDPYYNAQWAPQIYYDELNDKLYYISSMVVDSDKTSEMEIDSNTVSYTYRAFKTFCCELVYENGTFAKKGDVFVLDVLLNGDARYTYDSTLTYHDGYYYLLYKDSEHNIVNIAKSQSIYGNFDTTQINIFGQPYTEAPNVVKNNDLYYIYGVQYSYGGQLECRNSFCIVTKDFERFSPVGFVGRTDIVTDRDSHNIRNIAPIKIDSNLLDSFDIVYRKIDVKPSMFIYGSLYWARCMNLYTLFGSKFYPFPDTSIKCYGVYATLHIYNFWNAQNISVCADGNSTEIPHRVYEIIDHYGNNQSRRFWGYINKYSYTNTVFELIREHYGDSGNRTRGGLITPSRLNWGTFYSATTSSISGNASITIDVKGTETIGLYRVSIIIDGTAQANETLINSSLPFPEVNRVIGCDESGNESAIHVSTSGAIKALTAINRKSYYKFFAIYYYY